jgi:hypothetical protein
VRGTTETFVFEVDQPGPVVTQMDRLGAKHGGWINLTPLVREEDQPSPPDGLMAIFSGPIHEIPVCTWVPGRLGRKGVERDSLGIQHDTGSKVVARLASLGVPLPPGWRWQQDHPRRGLVVRPPLDVAHADQLAWLLEAGIALSRVRLTGRWEVKVREGR